MSSDGTDTPTGMGIATRASVATSPVVAGIGTSGGDMTTPEPHVTPAHDQTLTIRIIEHVPAHGDRGAAFDKAKQRMKQLGIDKCVIEGCGTGAKVEYHHSVIEHAWQEGVDVAKLDEAFGLHLTDADFVAWVQSPGNLEPLCVVHHRTQLGVHALPEPLWNAVRVWRKDLPPPAEHVTASKPTGGTP